MTTNAVEAADVPDRQHALLVVLAAAHDDIVEYMKLVELARGRGGGGITRVRDVHDGYQYLALSPIDNDRGDADVRHALAMIAQACAGNLADAFQQVSKLVPLGPIRRCHRERADLATMLAKAHRQVLRLTDVRETLLVAGLDAAEVSALLRAACQLADSIVSVVFEGRKLRQAVPVRPRHTHWAPRLAGLAVYVLPQGSRGRYEEEFRAELWELGWRGTSRAQQLLHSLSLLNRALDLRAELIHRNPHGAEADETDSPATGAVDSRQPHRPHRTIVIILAVTGLLSALAGLLRVINETVQLFR